MLLIVNKSDLRQSLWIACVRGKLLDHTLITYLLTYLLTLITSKCFYHNSQYDQTTTVLQFSEEAFVHIFYEFH